MACSWLGWPACMLQRGGGRPPSTPQPPRSKTPARVSAWHCEPRGTRRCAGSFFRTAMRMGPFGGLPHPGFRIQVERCRGNHTFVCLKAFEDLHTSVEAPTGLDLPRFELTFATLYIDGPRQSRVHNRIDRNHDSIRQ